MNLFVQIVKKKTHFCDDNDEIKTQIPRQSVFG